MGAGSLLVISHLLAGSLSSSIDGCFAAAFAPSHTANARHTAMRRRRHPSAGGGRRRWQLADDDDDDSDARVPDDADPAILRGIDEGEISDEMWETIEGGEPSQWQVMQSVSPSGNAATG